jgi:hypothetical protein
MGEARETSRIGRVIDPSMNSMGLSIHKTAGYAAGATRPHLGESVAVQL